MEMQFLELTKLQIEFIVGLDEKGEPKFKRKTLSNINSNVDAAGLKKAADAIISLQQYKVGGVKRLDTWMIEEN